MLPKERKPLPPGREDRKDHTPDDPMRQTIWYHVQHSPVANLWDFQGTSPLFILRRTFTAFNDDNLVSRAAELGYYFLFALFPTLVCASAIVGLAAQHAADVSRSLLNYLSLIVPKDALSLVLDTFNQTTLHSSGGKLAFGLAAAIWSASVGFSAIQDTLNIVYKVKETRPYWKARGSAMLVTVLLAIIIFLTLACLLVGTFSAHFIRDHVPAYRFAVILRVTVHILFDIATAAMLTLLFAVIYYFAPDIKNKRWRWLTPGATIGILFWFLGSFALRIYLHYFNSFSVTYGSLGAVIILLTWFYLTGLMLLLGAEINSEIEACVTERKLKQLGEIPFHATAEPAA